MWYALIANLAVVGLLLSAFAHGEPLLLMLGPRIRAAALGGVMGLGAIASIMLSVELPDGTVFDLRATLIGVSSLLGGPIAGLITAALVATHLLLVSGSGATADLVGIAVATGLGEMFEDQVNRG